MYFLKYKGTEIFVSNGNEVRLVSGGDMTYRYELGEEFGQIKHLPNILEQVILLTYVHESLRELKKEISINVDNEVTGRLELIPQLTDQSMKYLIHYRDLDMERVGEEVYEHLGFKLETFIGADVINENNGGSTGIVITSTNGFNVRNGTYLDLTAFEESNWENLKDYVRGWVRTEFYKLVYGLEDDFHYELVDGIMSGKLELKVK